MKTSPQLSPIALSVRVLVVPALVACTSPHDAAKGSSIESNLSLASGTPRQTISEVQTLEPDEEVEGIMTGGPADSAAIHLTAPMQLDWNIHSHASGRATIIKQEFGTALVDETFVPPSNGDWFILIRNSGNVTADIPVRIDLFGDMQWRWE